MTARASATRLATFQEPPRSLRVLFWMILPFAAAHVILATISGYRAIVQMYRIELTTDTPTLRAGETVAANAPPRASVPSPAAPVRRTTR